MLIYKGMILINQIAIPILLILFTACQIAAQEARITPLEESYLRDDAGLLNREQREVIFTLLERHNKQNLGRIYLDVGGLVKTYKNEQKPGPSARAGMQRRVQPLAPGC